jgi:hypothetical protein
MIENTKLISGFLVRINDDMKFCRRMVSFHRCAALFAFGCGIIGMLDFYAVPNLISLSAIAVQGFLVWWNLRSMFRAKRRIKALRVCARSVFAMSEVVNATALDHHVDQFLAALNDLGIATQVSGVPQ